MTLHQGPGRGLDLDQQAVTAIVRGRHGDPFAILGMHGGGKRPLEVRVFSPTAADMRVLEADGEREVARLERIDPEGFFAGVVAGRSEPFAYRLQMAAGTDRWTIEDPYRFPPILGDLDIYLFREGTHRGLYEVMGAHPRTVDGVPGVAFAVWAPNAERVSVIGGFNAWDGRRHPMRKRVEIGVWELFVPGLDIGEIYKFELIGPDGALLPQKADPFAFRTEVPPATAAVVKGAHGHAFDDESWMTARQARHRRDAPISIYEVHAGSWRRLEDGSFMTFDRLADELVPYVKEMGFTHIELMPISEHPFSGSWGYQPIGLFAPTSRFGPPEAFARFVDRCHADEIGVIVDWVPAHFPSDEHGLARFDGTALYEHADPRQGFHQDWNTLIYNFGRTEVRNFLVSNALFWLDRYHVDALRVDAVASMLYLDYSREPGAWVPNVHGGNENLEAIAFLKETNARAFGDHPGVTTIAEESTAWPGVSCPVDAGGLGFGFKWNMGWMHDTLSYMKEDPINRRYHHDKITFGLHYAFSENFVLPLSHDEVVHGKGSLIDRMPGDRWQRFANLRAYYGFMWTHPGKKLLFMGGEFGQWQEWNHDRALDWHLLDDPDHAGVKALVADLNRLYRSDRRLHARDCEEDGFVWIDGGNAENSVFIYARTDGVGTPVVVVANFTPVVRESFRIGVPKTGAWREILNTDDHRYAGSGVLNGGDLQASDEGWHGQPASLLLTLPPLATIVLGQPA